MTTKYHSFKEALEYGFDYAGRADLRHLTLEDAKRYNAIIVKEDEVIGNMSDPEGNVETQSKVTLLKFNNHEGKKVRIAIEKYQDDYWKLWVAIGTSNMLYRT